MSRNLTRAHEDLTTAWRGLQRQWQALRDEWQDNAGRRFARDQWPPFEQTVPPVLREIDALNQLIQQARRDVE